MISKAHRSVVEVLLYAIVCFMCFSKFVLMRIGALINVDYLSSSAAAVPLVVRWRTDALSEDYAEVRNKAAVIAFSIVAQCAAAIACKHSAVHYDCASIYFYSVAKIHAAFLGLLISAFNRMEIKERDLSIPDDESSFWNSDRSRESSVRETVNVETNRRASLNDNVQSEKVLRVKQTKNDATRMIWKDSKISSRHTC